MFVIANSVDEPLSPAVKTIIKDKTQDKLETVSDDAKIHWVDVKKAYPDIAQQLKDLFKGKSVITVKDLKETLVEDQDDMFWLSEDKYDYRHGQAELEDYYGKDQEVLQYNIDNKIIQEIKKDPLLDTFFTEYSRLMASSPHPVHTQTLGWIRYYKFDDFWVIEEIQSDLFGEDTKLRNLANSDVKDIIGEYDEADQKKLEQFFEKNFKDWDKKLVGSLISKARREGVDDIWIFDEDIKRDTQVSPSKRKHFYKKIPRDMGFKRDQLKVDDKDLKAWHRAVAEHTQQDPTKLTPKKLILAALASIEPHFREEHQTDLQAPGEPSVASEDEPVFDEDIMARLAFHRAKALAVPDFESFMALLEAIAAEEGLNPAQDFDNLASVLNRYRVEKGLDPL